MWTEAQITEAETAIEALEATATKAEDLANPGWVTRTWANIIGAESSLSAQGTDAKAARTFAVTMRDVMSRTADDGDDASFRNFIAACKGESGDSAIAASIATANQLSPRTFVNTMADGFRQYIPSLSTLGNAVIVALVVVVSVLIIYAVGPTVASIYKTRKES